MGLLLLYLLLALSISFLCSIAEAVILTVSISFVEAKEKEQKKGARLLKKYKSDIDFALSAILSLNTIAHTVGAAGVGAQASIVFGDAYFGVVSAVLTFLILILSEILPKSIGARYWRELAIPIAKIINVMVYVAYPIVKMSNAFTKLFSSKKQMQKVSREEVAALAQIGVSEGVFAESESKFILNLISLKNVRTKEIMTPRTVVLAASEDCTLEDFFNKEDVAKHSRFPIYKGGLDNVTGYVLKSDISEKLVNEDFAGKTLKDLKREIPICHENTTIPKLLEIFLKEKVQIALVVDEYGGMDGIVSMEDIIEAVFGSEIIDETDVQTDMQKLAKEKWKAKAEHLKIVTEEDDK